jgi:hypothetical protein
MRKEPMPAPLRAFCLIKNHKRNRIHSGLRSEQSTFLEVLMKKSSILICIACLCVSVWAQEGEQIYTVIDVLDEQKTTQETWTVHGEEIGGASAFRLIKKPKMASPRVELHSFWFKEIRTPGQPTYWKEVVIFPPDFPNTRQTGFGFIEEKKVDTGEVIQSWPLFFKMTRTEEVVSIAYEVYLSGGDHLTILREYTEGNTIFPLREIHLRISGGKVVGHTIFSRQ